MGLLAYALPALAVAQTAFAASCSTSATATIQNAGDATGLATCQTFTGSIAIATGTTDAIALDGIEKLDGNLVVNNASHLTSLSAADMETITGEFNLNDCQTLSTLGFPKLSVVDTITWLGLPALQQLTFTSGVEQASSVDIENTQLNSLDGISLQVVDKFTIANNNFLNEITAQLGNITGSLTLEGNGPNLAVSFPNLVWAFNMSIHGAKSFSAPILVSLNSSLGFISNTMSTVTCPNLTTVGGDLSFMANNGLTNFTLPVLTKITGGFLVRNNTDLQIINGVNKLQTIGGALDFSGNFTEVDLPALTEVAGAFNMQSSADISSTCDHFNSIHGSNNVIRGKITCAGGQSSPGGLGTTPTGTGASSTATKTGAASHLDVSSSAVMGFSGVLAAIFGLL